VGRSERGGGGGWERRSARGEALSRERVKRPAARKTSDSTRFFPARADTSLHLPRPVRVRDGGRRAMGLPSFRNSSNSG